MRRTTSITKKRARPSSRRSFDCCRESHRSTSTLRRVFVRRTTFEHQRGKSLLLTRIDFLFQVASSLHRSISTSTSSLCKSKSFRFVDLYLIFCSAAASIVLLGFLLYKICWNDFVDNRWKMSKVKFWNQRRQSKERRSCRGENATFVYLFLVRKICFCGDFKWKEKSIRQKEIKLNPIRKKIFQDIETRRAIRFGRREPYSDLERVHIDRVSNNRTTNHSATRSLRVSCFERVGRSGWTSRRTVSATYERNLNKRNEDLLKSTWAKRKPFCLPFESSFDLGVCSTCWHSCSSVGTTPSWQGSKLDKSRLSIGTEIFPVFGWTLNGDLSRWFIPLVTLASRRG